MIKNYLNIEEKHIEVIKDSLANMTTAIGEKHQVYPCTYNSLYGILRRYESDFLLFSRESVSPNGAMVQLYFDLGAGYGGCCEFYYINEETFQKFFVKPEVEYNWQEEGF